MFHLFQDNDVTLALPNLVGRLYIGDKAIPQERFIRVFLLTTAMTDVVASAAAHNLMNLWEPIHGLSVTIEGDGGASLTIPCEDGARKADASLNVMVTLGDGRTQPVQIFIELGQSDSTPTTAFCREKVSQVRAYTERTGSGLLVYINRQAPNSSDVQLKFLLDNFGAPMNLSPLNRASLLAFCIGNNVNDYVANLVRDETITLSQPAAEPEATPPVIVNWNVTSGQRESLAKETAQEIFEYLFKWCGRKVVDGSNALKTKEWTGANFKKRCIKKVDDGIERNNYIDQVRLVAAIQPCIVDVVRLISELRTILNRLQDFDDRVKTGCSAIEELNGVMGKNPTSYEISHPSLRNSLPGDVLEHMTNNEIAVHARSNTDHMVNNASLVWRCYHLYRLWHAFRRNQPEKKKKKNKKNKNKKKKKIPTTATKIVKFLKDNDAGWTASVTHMQHALHIGPAMAKYGVQRLLPYLRSVVGHGCCCLLLFVVVCLLLFVVVCC